MRKLFFKLIVLLCPIVTLAQESPSDIQVVGQSSSEISDVADLMAMTNIRYEKVLFTSKNLIGKNYAIRVLDIWDGEVRDSTVLINSIKSKKTIADSVFELRVAHQLDADGNIVIRFATPLGATKKVFKTVPEKGFIYSLRNLVTQNKESVAVGKTFYLMAFVQPIADPARPGVWSYCNVENSGEDVRGWGKKLGLDHYIVYQMSFF